MADRNPDSSSLHAAALAHLARYGTTRVGLTRVLDRRVDRWARATSPEAEAIRAAKQAVREVVARLVASGVVNDAAFAEARARSLTRVGRSRLAVTAHLAARGVAGDVLRKALPGDGETELAAAVALARRRRIGPFRAGEGDEETRHRELGVLARAGYPQDVAQRALDLDPEQAEDLVNRLRKL